jgi:hypothetical protein
MVAITTGHPVHTCYNIFWPPGLQWLQYISATWSAIGTINVVIYTSHPVCN